MQVSKSGRTFIPEQNRRMRKKESGMLNPSGEPEFEENAFSMKMRRACGYNKTLFCPLPSGSIAERVPSFWRPNALIELDKETIEEVAKILEACSYVRLKEQLIRHSSVSEEGS